MGERPDDQDSIKSLTPLPRSRTGRQIVTAAQRAGWTVHVTPGAGTVEVLDPDRPVCKCSKSRKAHRHESYTPVPCQSEGVRLRHPDGRCAVAVLISLDGKRWSGDDAWTWGPTYSLTQTTPGQLLSWLRSESEATA